MTINSIKSCSSQTALPCHPDMDAPLPFGCCECQWVNYDRISKSAVNSIYGRTEVYKRMFGFTGIRKSKKLPASLEQTLTISGFKLQRHNFLYYRFFESVTHIRYYILVYINTLLKT